MKKKVLLLEENIPVTSLDLITVCRVIPETWHFISEKEIGLKMWSSSGLAECLYEA